MQKLNFKNFIFTTFLALLLPVFSFSQGGSNYSALGLGDFNSRDNAFVAGMGGASIAIPSATSLSMTNPAAWSFIRTTRLNVGYLFNQNAVSSESGTLWQNNGNVNGFTAAMNVNPKNGITIGLGLKPKTQVRYYIATPVSIESDGIYAEGKTSYRGEGGLNDAFIGISGILFKKVALGAYANYTFGTVNRYTQSLFVDDVTMYSPSSTEVDKMTGWSGSFGALVDIGAGFKAGAVFKASTDLTVKSETAYFGVSSSTDTLITSPEYTTEIPLMYGAGISYEYERIILGLDYTHQDFSSLNYNQGADTRFRSTNGISLGFNLSKPKRVRNFVDKVSWRGGLAYNNLYYTVAGQDIDEMSLSLGASVPAGKSLLFDIGIVLGTRGTTNSDLVQENFGRLMIDFSIGEAWFKRFERDFTVEDED
jgi:hypothetical protein